MRLRAIRLGPLRRASVTGSLLTFLGLGACGFLPLFGGPGYEAALAAGLFLPSLAACTRALVPLEPGMSPLRRALSALGYGAWLGALALGLTLLHGLRVGFCAPGPGVLAFALGPGVGACLGALWGALARSVAERLKTRRKRLVALLLAFAGPLGTAVFSVGRFYTSPMVFAFDPFVGFFAGPLYETVIDPNLRLAMYRLGSLFSVLAVLSGCFALRAKRNGAVSLARPVRAAALLASALFFCASVAITLAGPELGHYQTTSSIAQQLGRRLAGQRCVLLFSRTILERDAELVLSECEAHVAQIERYFDVTGTPPIDVFLFASAAEKGALMGASHTYIAKPWRREIYVQQDGYPHPVLGHELAHVIAGNFGRGPFRVAGPFAGLLPDPGRIEGFAVAASPRLDADLNLQQWAETLRRLQLLPPLTQVFRLSFLGVNSSTAYTVAGAFVEWLRATHGVATLRAWYAGDSLSNLTGRSLQALEQAWHLDLQHQDVSSAALDAARARFDRPAIFGRRCPHEVDALEAAASAALGAGDVRGAIEKYQELLALDTRHVAALLGLAQCARMNGAVTEAERQLQDLARAAWLHPTDRARADEALGDLAFSQGDVARASDYYRKVMLHLVDEDHLRALDVKLSAQAEPAQSAVRALLVGSVKEQPGWEIAGPELGAWAALSAEPLPRFLLGKNLFLRGRWEEAGRYLDAALERPGAAARVRREALRTRLWLGCARRELAIAQRVLDELVRDPDLAAGNRAGLAAFATRCGLTLASDLAAPSDHAQ